MSNLFMNQSIKNSEKSAKFQFVNSSLSFKQEETSDCNKASRHRNGLPVVWI